MKTLPGNVFYFVVLGLLTMPVITMAQDVDAELRKIIEAPFWQSNPNFEFSIMW